MSAFIDEHERFGVEPVCRIQGVSACAYYQRRSGLPSRRAVSDERLLLEIRRVPGTVHTADAGRWDGGEMVLGLAAGMLGCWSNPNARATSARRGAPSFAPSRANTELHDTVNASVKDPPQASPPAFRSSTPDRVAEVRIG